MDAIPTWSAETAKRLPWFTVAANALADCRMVRALSWFAHDDGSGTPIGPRLGMHARAAARSAAAAIVWLAALMVSSMRWIAPRIVAVATPWKNVNSAVPRMSPH